MGATVINARKVKRLKQLPKSKTKISLRMKNSRGMPQPAQLDSIKETLRFCVFVYVRLIHVDSLSKTRYHLNDG